MPNLGFDLDAFGPNEKDVKKAQLMIQENLRDGLCLGLKRSAILFRDGIRQAITTQGSSVNASWGPASVNVDETAAQQKRAPWYVRRKGDNRPLLDTWEYRNSWIVISDDKNCVYRVSPGEDKAVHGPSGLWMQGLAELFEMGWTNALTGREVLARPHIEPVANAKQADMLRVAELEITRSVRRAAVNLQARRQLAKVRGRRR